MRFFLWLFYSLAWCQYAWMFNGIYVNENKIPPCTQIPSHLFMCDVNPTHDIHYSSNSSFIFAFHSLTIFLAISLQMFFWELTPLSMKKNGSSKFFFFAVLKNRTFSFLRMPRATLTTTMSTVWRNKGWKNSLSNYLFMLCFLDVQ